MSAEDIIEINHLTNRYNQAADSGNGEAFAATFTEDGVLEMPGSDPIAGRNALVVSGDSFPQLIEGVRHWTNNQVVEIEATPENLGMVNKINYLVEVEEI